MFSDKYFFSYEGKGCKSNLRFVTQPLQNPTLRKFAPSLAAIIKIY
jgi:hypothetical protein